MAHRSQPPSHQGLKTGLRLHQEGHLDEAARVYHEVLRRDPKHPNALHLLGVLFHQRGDHSRAVHLITKAIAANPSVAEFHNNLGEAYRALGKLDEAVASYRRALALRPDYAVAHNNLGNALAALGRPEEAVASYRRALESRPDHALTHFNLGNALAALGRQDEAAESHRQAVGLRADFAEAHLNLGNLLREQGSAEEAERHYRTALRLNPDLWEAHNNLGAILYDRGALKDAVGHFQQALTAKPDDADAHLNLGKAFAGLRMREQGEESYRRALGLRPDDAEAHACLGTLFRTSGRLEEATACYRAALEIQPDHPEAVTGEARVLEIHGRFEEAFARLAPVVEAGTDNVTVAMAYADLATYSDRRDEAVTVLRRALRRPHLERASRASLLFRLGGLYDRDGAYDDAFACLREANALKEGPFDAGRHAAYVSAIMKNFDREALVRLPRAANRSDVPVFVVGMPRSGTTLVEQILASHPEVFGAGELHDIGRTAASLSAELGVEEPYPQCVSSLTQQSVEAAASRYLARIEGMSGGARRVTDKLPANFLHLGLIALLFPRARVVHCLRDPLDTCLACYFRDFTAEHPYAHDLDNLAAYYGEYRRLMGHWREVLDIPLLEVRYEELVDRQEEVSRGIVAFCGLAWDDRCLRFHETSRAVHTPSKEQVRRPIYRSAVRRWRHYECHLGPLIEALGDLAKTGDEGTEPPSP